MKKNYIFLVAIFLFIECKTEKKNILNTKNNYASHFEINNYKNFKILKVKEAWKGGKDFKYVLSKSKKNVPDSLKNLIFIKIPVKRIIVTSTTHLPALEMLGVPQKLIGFPNIKYISSKIFRDAARNRKLKEIGNGANLNIEETIKLKPELLVVFSSGNDQKNYSIFEKHHIPVLYNADWMETSPLGRSEWIKVFGLLFNKTNEADKIFDNIVFEYTKIKNKIKNKSKKVKVFQGGIFGDKWFVPGGKSYVANLIKDAGGTYLWKDDKHLGSISLNFENVLVKLPQADVWLNPGSIVSKSALIKNIPKIKNYKSVKNNNIYTYVLTKGKTGGMIYFETSQAHPDWVLADLYHIFYPNESKNYKFHYYSKLLP